MNDDLISRSSIAAEVKNLSSSPLNEWDTLGVLELIYRQPSVDPHKHGRWISVKDRLPEEKTRVLVFVPHSSIKIDTDRIVGRIWVRWRGHVTHWMPLPEPPEEEAHTNGD